MDKDEFSEIVKGVKGDVIAEAKALLLDALVDAVCTVIRTAMHAEKEDLRYRAATFIIQHNLGDKGKSPEEAWETFFKQINSDR